MGLLKVIEHVADPAEFCKSLSALTIPDGAIVISTINRSMRAYAAAIIGAEYLLHWVLFLFSFYNLNQPVDYIFHTSWAAVNDLFRNLAMLSYLLASNRDLP